MRVMAAPRKYSVELQQQTTRMAMDARKDPESARGAIKRVADQLGVHPEALRNWVRQAEIDGGVRPGTTTDDAQRLAETEAVASVGSKGDSYDNAMAEALNSLFKTELVGIAAAGVRLFAVQSSQRTSQGPTAIRGPLRHLPNQKTSSRDRQELGGLHGKGDHRILAAPNSFAPSIPRGGP